jgi:DNA-binding response OmpR family regulator
MLLRLEGFEVITVTGVEAALIALDNHTVDLIITDWMMPGQSGRVLCQRVRERSSSASLPIIAATALAEPMPPRCYDRYVRKPVEFKHLLGVIRALLN